MTVTVQLRGGLGNQLFQYATGLEISLAFDKELIIDESLLPLSDINQTQVTLRSNQISSFDHSGSVRRIHFSKNRNKTFQRLYGLERLIGETNLHKMQEICGIYAREGSSNFVQLKPNRRLRINAPCINPSFFPSVRDRLISELRSPVNPTHWFTNQLQKAKAEKPIGVHLRLGDYQNLKKVYGEPSRNYYQNAIRLILEHQKTVNRPIWLYSDNPAGALDFFSEHISFDEVMLSPEESRPIESLLLLSESSSIVAANSTYSWWAAFLSQNDGLTIFPRPLFGLDGPSEPKSFLLEDWIQLGR